MNFHKRQKLDAQDENLHQHSQGLPERGTRPGYGPMIGTGGIHCREAAEWYYLDIRTTQALLFRKYAMGPKEVQHWVDRGLTPDKAAAWLRKGKDLNAILTQGLKLSQLTYTQTASEQKTKT